MKLYRDFGPTMLDSRYVKMQESRFTVAETFCNNKTYEEKENFS